jgi:hypothetical protein
MSNDYGMRRVDVEIKIEREGRYTHTVWAADQFVRIAGRAEAARQALRQVADILAKDDVKGVYK